jgi:PqqD family protein of HPr-rel-A system
MSGKLDDSLGARWRAAGCSRASLRLWDDEIAVYNTASGQTHMLHPLAGDLLLALLDAPAETEALVARVARDARIAPDECRATVARLLEEMDALGLVAREA